MATEIQKLNKAAFALRDTEQHVQLSEENEKKRLEMTIYSGGVIKGHWWWGDLAIDLSGLKFPKKKYPILENHMTDKKIAFMGKPLTNGSLTVNDKTVEFVDTEESNEFQRLSKQGFPYEASMYAIPSRIEKIEDGAKADVNGMSFKGPGTIWREATFKEASVCVFGYDTNTRSVAFGENDEMEITMDVVHVINTPEDEPKEEKFERKEESQMDMEKLKSEHPDLVDQIRAEVTDELTEKFDQQKAELENQLKKKDETISSQEERVLKLEKAETIRVEKERRDFADRLWETKLAKSNIPEYMYPKIKKMVSYVKFVENDKLDEEAFSAAIDAEIKDWEDSGMDKNVIGTGFSKKQVDGDGESKEALLAKEDEAAVEEMLKLSGLNYEQLQ